jgi:hypothetical protein
MSADQQTACLNCGESIFSYAFSIKNDHFNQCKNCQMLFPQRIACSKQVVHTFRNVDNTEILASLFKEALSVRQVAGTCLLVLDQSRSVLAEHLTQTLPNKVISTSLSALPADGKFSAVILLDSLSLMRHTSHFIDKVSSMLNADGTFIFLQTMLDSKQAKLMKNSWFGFTRPHHFYPVIDTLHMLLLNHGFAKVWFRRARYLYHLGYIHKHFSQLRKDGCSRLTSLLNIPILRNLKCRLPSSHVIVSCQKAPPKSQPLLSIILPVFNEKNTVEKLIQAVIDKPLSGLAKEIIIVESNSTDGSRQIVANYAAHPEVKIVWQEKANGKGDAVRAGLASANGDFVLIQDADLEYDVNDYDALLAPVQNNQAMFVLGSRHSGSWRIRSFNDTVGVATVFNMGHVFFTWFINLLTRQKMTDPFTMFKVIRMDALFGLNFICKRFDFDHEMVIKLIRKGYKPLELPVNYQARSFSEGKKVSFIKDGLTWLYTDIKLRYGRLGHWKH